MAAERAFTVKVAEVNRAPVLAPIADQQARAGAAMTVVAVASDPDIPENLLRFSVDGPAGMTVDDSGTLTWTPGDADVGPHQVTVRVLDDGAPRKQDERTFTVTVTAAGGGGGGGPAPAPGPSNGGDGGGGIPPLPGPGSGGGRTPRPPRSRPSPPPAPAAA
ncbi:MAG: Ig domain-containing protein [Thermoleophilia bacterium]